MGALSKTFYAFTADAGLNIGDKPYLTQYSGAHLNVFPRGSAFNSCGIYLRTTNNANIGIYSSVDSNTKLTFASGLISGGFSNYNFYVRGNGETYTQGVLITSDSVLKRDIKPLSGSLDKILKMRGVTYFYKDVVSSIGTFDENSENDMSENKTGNTAGTINISRIAKNGVPEIDPAVLKIIEAEDKSRKHIGLLAQEVESVAPEVVRTSINGTKAIAYSELIALLIEGMKEQQSQIEELKTELYVMKSTSPAVQKAPQIQDSENVSTVNASLYQNTPNPFPQSTQINYYLPETVNTAQLCIYDLQGKQLKQIVISERGEGVQTISGSELKAGIYLYALLADGKEVDVKRMILTE